MNPPRSRRSSPSGPKLSRRSFLKGTGQAAAGATVAETALVHCTAPPKQARRPSPLGPGAVPIILKVNGEARPVSVEPQTTLADALRRELHLTGTKVACDRGACSACTVWLDGVPVNACCTWTLDVGERAVTTIEGLADGEDLHPVQAAFISRDAMQCGFCTPGMVMRCAHLIGADPEPTEDDVRRAISGNLCRCGTYNHVVEATLEAASDAIARRESKGGGS